MFNLFSRKLKGRSVKLPRIKLKVKNNIKLKVKRSRVYMKITKSLLVRVDKFKTMSAVQNYYSFLQKFVFLKL